MKIKSQKQTNHVNQRLILSLFMSVCALWQQYFNNCHFFMFIFRTSVSHTVPSNTTHNPSSDNKTEQQQILWLHTILKHCAFAGCPFLLLSNSSIWFFHKLSCVCGGGGSLTKEWQWWALKRHNVLSELQVVLVILKQLADASVPYWATEWQWVTQQYSSILRNSPHKLLIS